MFKHSNLQIDQILINYIYFLAIVSVVLLISTVPYN